jgi:aspartate-semialdehyde dehydrogenase
MVPRRGKREGSARVALVGAASPEAAPVRKALASFGVSGKRIDLFGSTRGETVLSEYDGEARLVQEPDLSEIRGHDLVLLCESGEAADRFWSLGDRGPFVIDMAGCGGDRNDVPLVHMDVNPLDAGDRAGVARIPHALSLILAELMHPLDREFEVTRATAMVMRPAADFGEPGIEELRDQAVRLLNFSSPPTEVFGRQLIFNVLPDDLADSTGQEQETRVVREVQQLLGWSDPRLAFRLVTVPVFHGHAFLVDATFRRPASMEAVSAALAEAKGIEVTGDDSTVTPFEAAGKRQTLVPGIFEDGLGGTWIWAVAGEVESVPAEHALRLATAVCDL